MAVIKSRAEGVMPTESIQLIAKFYDFTGNLTDLDSFPTISIIEPDGRVIFSPTSSGVYKLNTGTYAFLYEIPYTTVAGVYVDVWQGLLGGFPMQAQFNFVVELGQQQKLNDDGYIALGDIVGFDFDQVSIANINQLLKGLKARLNSSGLVQTTDSFGNPTYTSCDIFSTDQLVTFLCTSLSAFNMIPTFTEFTFRDSEIIRTFYSIIMQYAVILALSSKALIERGREFGLSDNGVSFTPPSVSELLNSQYSAELGNWTDMVKLIKANMKPIGMGISCYQPLGSPRLRILRTLRSRQIF